MSNVRLIEAAPFWYTTARIGSFAIGFLGLNEGSFSRHFVIALGGSTP